MKTETKRAAACVLACALLGACAMTPEQRAAYEAEQERRYRQTAVALAGQCDPEAARLMALQFQNYAGLSEAERKQAQADYRKILQSPLYQSCYRMAWENLAYRERAEAAERREMRREMWMMYRPYPYWW